MKSTHLIPENLGTILIYLHVGGWMEKPEVTKPGHDERTGEKTAICAQRSDFLTIS